MTARYLLCSTALSLLAVPAFADVTVDDVWSNWQMMMSSSGEVSVEDESRSGSSLELSGVTVTTQMPDGSTSTSIDMIRMTETGSGTVEITTSPDYRITMSQTTPDGPMNMAMTLTQSGLTTTASGNPGAISYDYAADGLEVTIDEFDAPDAPDTFDMRVALTDVSGVYDVTEGATADIDSRFEAGALIFDVSFGDPDGSGTVTGRMENLTANSSGNLPIFSAGSNMSALLGEGLSTTGSFNYGPGAYTMEASGPDGDTMIESSADTGELTFSLQNGGVSYSGRNTNVAVNMIVPGAMMPPLAFEIAESSGKIEMPLVQTDDARAFGIELDMQDLQVSDTVWSMIDPTNALPHDPADISLDIDGQGSWAIDILDPEAAQAQSGEMPGEVESIDIKNLLISVLGAELTGTGSFSFDNSSMPPAPEGQVDLQLVGANTLIDRLVGAGLLPEDQAMGARMMMGLFARPGAGEDTLVSTIEVNADGSVLANGQRIK